MINDIKLNTCDKLPCTKLYNNNSNAPTRYLHRTPFTLDYHNICFVLTYKRNNVKT